jgi:flavin-dependent dehydrogenase
MAIEAGAIEKCWASRSRPVILIIGAGPAGCAAALAVGTTCRAVVIERGPAKKDKPCGDALISRAVSYIKRFGIDEERLQALGGRPFDTISVSTPKVAFDRIDAGGTGYILRRATIDQELRNAIAPLASIYYQTTALSLERHERDGWIVTVRSGRSIHCLRCDIVILATGSGSSLPRRFGVDGKPQTVSAVTAYVNFPGLIPCPKFLFDSQNKIYEWVFPAQNGANLGCCALHPTHISKLRHRVEQLKRAHGHDRSGQLRGGLIELWSGNGQSWHNAGGIVSCGDAAGIVDPYSAEGISGALESGFRAGIASSQFALEKASGPLEAYSLWVRDAFNQKHMYSRSFWSTLGTISEAHR